MVMGLSTLLLCFVALAATAHAQSDSGFISIDCGHAGERYTDQSTQMVYSPDAPYIDTGVNMDVSPAYDLNFARRYGDLRSFPSGTRNCYTLTPVQRGRKYLVRAGFVYGNYDGQNQTPEFDLYLGVNRWKTVIADSVMEEIIAIAPADSMQVCLVNKGTGTPFISTLELRPLQDSMYAKVNASQSLVLHQSRYNYGGRPNVQIRFPDDPYDRIWYTPENRTGWTPLRSDDAQVFTESSREFQVPSAVMRTATTTASLSWSLNLTVAGKLGDKIYVFMHFAELRLLGANQTREFDVYSDGDLWYGPYRPRYLNAGQLYTDRPGPGGTSNYSLTATRNSTLPPILNALEVYTTQKLSLLPTNDSDVTAILSIKQLYRVGKNWEGDPCAPKEFMWDGVGCSDVDASEKPRIISLNLSSSGLSGGIPASIANLTALKTLDLSHNNFTGEIPGYLGELPALNILNLASNQLNGSIPQILSNKSQDGSLLLSIDDNPNLCYEVGSCEASKQKKKKIIVPIIVAASISLVLLLVILILIWYLKRGRTQDASKTHESIDDNLGQKDSLQTESHQFKFSEILRITNNFQKAIGKGGFGIVYHGYLPDKAQVAVKLLSQSSSQGTKEFQAEAVVLTRVHHKNLVSLLGYCNDMNNLALVYEFMPQDSIAKHLHGGITQGNYDTASGLSWRMRLTIALDSAQGLDYLHNGCKPPIVHRDVKTANILLTENFGAKLADFGLSRAFINEEVSHISTKVAGTPGYLDPEYYQTYRLNEKSDVYSFGVVLMELITGRTPISGGPDKIHITRWVLSKIEKGDIHSIADHRLQGNYDANSVWKAVDIAMACASLASVQRPTMSEVVVQLKECLATEGERDYSQVIPLNVDSRINPSAR